MSLSCFRRVPPVNVRITYALGIITLFPNLKDPESKLGYVSNDVIMMFMICFSKKLMLLLFFSAVK